LEQVKWEEKKNQTRKRVKLKG